METSKLDLVRAKEGRKGAAFVTKVIFHVVLLRDCLLLLLKMCIEMMEHKLNGHIHKLYFFP